MRGEGVSLSGKPTLPYPKIESRLLVLYKQSSVGAGNTSTHTHDYVTQCTRKCVCVCVCVCVSVNMLLLPTGRKNGKVYTSHYSLCKKNKKVQI